MSLDFVHIILYKFLRPFGSKRLTDYFTKWRQGQFCQSEVHLSEWDANDGDTENETIEDMGEPDPDATHEEPQYIHEYAQAAGLRRLPLHLRAERPDGQHT